jgi:hypothetical protein
MLDLSYKSIMHVVPCVIIYLRDWKKFLLKLRTVTGQDSQIDESVNSFLEYAKENHYEILDMTFKVALPRAREDKDGVHCIVFIRYDDGRQKVIE